MKIYTIEIEDWGWDCYSGHVVVAEDIDDVINLAKDKSADEGENIWDTARIIECGDYTGEREDPFILLSSFHAG